MKRVNYSLWPISCSIAAIGVGGWVSDGPITIFISLGISGSNHP